MAVYNVHAGLIYVYGTKGNVVREERVGTWLNGVSRIPQAWTVHSVLSCNMNLFVKLIANELCVKGSGLPEVISPGDPR